jgi:hypothetical protein
MFEALKTPETKRMALKYCMKFSENYLLLLEREGKISYERKTQNK